MRVDAAPKEVNQYLIRAERGSVDLSKLGRIHTDLGYAVGVTLYYLLTGRTPFEADNLIKLLATVLDQPPPSPAKWRPEISGNLARSVLRCLEKQPSQRYKNYADFCQAVGKNDVADQFKGFDWQTEEDAFMDGYHQHEKGGEFVTYAQSSSARPVGLSIATRYPNVTPRSPMPGSPAIRTDRRAMFTVPVAA